MKRTFLQFCAGCSSIVYSKKDQSKNILLTTACNSVVGLSYHIFFWRCVRTHVFYFRQCLAHHHFFASKFCLSVAQAIFFSYFYSNLSIKQWVINPFGCYFAQIIAHFLLVIYFQRLYSTNQCFTSKKGLYMV